MSKARKGGGKHFGDPRKRQPPEGAANEAGDNPGRDSGKRQSLAEQLAGLLQPSGDSDPLGLGGSIGGQGGPHDRHGAVLDMVNAVLMDQVDVAAIEAVRGSAVSPAIYLTLGGRVNKRPDRAQVGFLLNTDGAAAIITELLALTDRAGADLLGDLTRRLTRMHQNKIVNLPFLRAAIDNAIESEQHYGQAQQPG